MRQPDRAREHPVEILHLLLQFPCFEVVIIYVYIVETRYTPLEEISKFFDGEDVVEVVEVEIQKGDKEGVLAMEVEDA
jgi:hypothetical protein